MCVMIVSLHRRYVRPLDPSEEVEEEEDEDEELYKAQTNGVSDGMTAFSLSFLKSLLSTKTIWLSST